MTVSQKQILKDVFATWNKAFEESKPAVVTPITFGSEDPLALSWASYHNWIKTGSKYMPLEAVQPTDEDYSLAQQTRTYYRDRLTFKALKGIELTDFQHDLYKFLNASEFDTSQVGMLYKLPYFYLEDTTRQRIYDKTKSLSPRPAHRVNLDHIATLTPIEEILVTRRAGDRYEYWFTDTNKHGVCITVMGNNNMRSLVKGIWNRHQPTTIRANWHEVRNNHNRDYRYWMLTNMEIVF